MSQLESWDPRPEAPKEIRGEYKAIATSAPGVSIGEYLPGIATHADRLAIVRAMNHRARDHRQAVYWTLTGDRPTVVDGQLVADPIPPSRADRPSLGSMVASVRGTCPGQPGTITVPYSMAERGPIAGQTGGFLGVKYDPLFARPKSGKPFSGVSPLSVTPEFQLPDAVTLDRLNARRDLLQAIDREFSPVGARPYFGEYDYFHETAFDMLSSASLAGAFNLEQEPQKIRESYGDHILGQSTLLSRRLTEAGIPLVTVVCGAGDLNGNIGDVWDTHFMNHARLKNDLMPPFDKAATALLTDLADRGTLDETLVVFLTEFGRGPRINEHAGRDHSPDCYSIAFAGGGIRGGRVYGRSDRYTFKVDDDGSSPGDVHATIFHAMGIDPAGALTDANGHTVPLCEGRALPLF